MSDADDQDEEIKEEVRSVSRVSSASSSSSSRSSGQRVLVVVQGTLRHESVMRCKARADEVAFSIRVV